ncbi:MAG: molybdopterin-dependent oxidoreductase [Dokdonella sp.]|uniref:molybdopterin-dependent oxidoreductase n=1 Tax=Dokdonella sp. TaxID=2291710 RepID=UPI00326302C1
MNHANPWVRCAVSVLILAACASAPVWADTPPVPAGSVAIGGEIATPRRLDDIALRKLPRRAFDATEHGTTAHWEGVALSDLLSDAGVPLGDALRGKNLALYVVVSAADGYRVVYSLAELDPAMRGGDVILADRRNGQPLDANEGPFRIVAKDDKRPARWVRQVVAIDVLRASLR